MKIKTKWIILIFAGLSFFTSLSAQDTTNFFPHQVGDFWEYFFTDFIGEDTIQVEVVKDSMDQNGLHHIIQAARAINPIGPPAPFSFDTTRFILDTTKHQVLTYFSFGNGPLVKYKLDASEGDQWVLWQFDGGGFEMVRLSRVYQDTIFGVPTTLKDFKFYAANDSTDTLGLVRSSDILSDKFGLVQRTGAETGRFFFLKGAVLDGIIYGDTTLVGIEALPIGLIPDQMSLSQNYPNPFNPQTTIPFELLKSGYISLAIYDLNGKKVKDIINNEWRIAGSYQLEWDGKTRRGGDAASGIYFYQLMTGQQRLTRRMLLIR